MKRIVALLMALSTAAAFGQDGSFTVKKDLSSSNFLNTITPDSVSHFNIFEGPGLSGNKSNSFDSDGSEQEGSLESWHQVSFRYQLNDTTRLVINPRFTATYNASDTNKGRPAFKLSDPVIGFTTTWYKNGNFSFAGGLNTILYPLKDSSRQEQLVANPGGFNSLNYKVSNNFNVGSWVWARYNIKLKAKEDYTRLPYFIAPYVTYTFNDTFSIQPYYQINGDVSDIDIINNDPDESFNMLFSIRIAKALTIQPIITLFRDSEFDVTKGNLNMWISGTF